MRVRRDTVFAVLTTFSLSMILFTMVPTRSLEGGLPYDPWMDINDDGKIDMHDIGNVAARFMTTGEAINKTALLLELQAKIDALNTTIIEQQNTINNLNQTVVHLNETVAILNSTGLGAPDYDSGWQSLPLVAGLHLTHNLNTTDVIVYLIGKYYSPGGVVHQWSYGGSSITGDVEGYGAFWTELYNTTIAVYRGRNDVSNYIRWDYVRVMIWKIPQP